jgi:hypothetical protein
MLQSIVEVLIYAHRLRKEPAENPTKMHILGVASDLASEEEEADHGQGGVGTREGSQEKL